MERSLRSGDLVRTPDGGHGRIRGISKPRGGNEMLAHLVRENGNVEALPLTMLERSTRDSEKTEVAGRTVRLPSPDLDSIAEHLVRWHGVPIEQVQGVTLGNAFDHHASLHEKAKESGYRLGHRHDLSAAEVEILEQGAQAALRRSR